MEGWISLYRKILDNPLVCKDSDYYAVWGYLLLNATFKEYDVIFDNKRITLKPGQLICSRKSISDKFKISESKVQRVLKKFEIEQQIEQQTTRQNRLITILNWDIHQNSEQHFEQQVNNNWTTSEQQVNTNNKEIKKKRNKVNKEKEDKEKTIALTHSNSSSKDLLIKKTYGEFQNVLLTDEEYQKLGQEYSNTGELIKILDEYMEMKGDYKVKSHYAAIKRWVNKAAEERKEKSKENKTTYKTDSNIHNFQQREYDDDTYEQFYANLP